MPDYYPFVFSLLDPESSPTSGRLPAARLRSTFFSIFRTIRKDEPCISKVISPIRQPNRRFGDFNLTGCAGPTGPGAAAPGQARARRPPLPGSELPVPRNETIYLEDTSTFRIFDSYNTLIPNGNDFANGLFKLARSICSMPTSPPVKFNLGWPKIMCTTKISPNDHPFQDNVKWNDGQPFTADDVVFTVACCKRTGARRVPRWRNLSRSSLRQTRRPSSLR